MTLTDPSLPPHTPPPYRPPSASDLHILHCDAQIIVADKPAGLLSVPGLGPEKAVCAQSIVSERHGPVMTVHRLDMDTSGIIIFARTKPAQRGLSVSFERRLVVKHYEAVVDGRITGENGQINLAISRQSRQRPLRHIDPDGREALTEWQVLERADAATRLTLIPRTGRTHQLRLHLSAIGHPILGDPFYGDPSRANRLLLHAASLTIAHPGSGVSQCFTAPTPF